MCMLEWGFGLRRRQGWLCLYDADLQFAMYPSEAQGWRNDPERDGKDYGIMTDIADLLYTPPMHEIASFTVSHLSEAHVIST